MGRQAYGIVGGIIGAVVVGVLSDGTATAQGYAAGFALGSAIGGIAGSYIDPIVLQGNKIGDNQLQVAAEGGARAIMFGRACVTATCVIARGNRKLVKHKDSNGKGSSGTTANESVYWTFAIGLGESLKNASIARIWQDDNLVYDVLNDGAVSDSDNAKFGAKFKFYEGNEEQLPDPDLQVFLGEDTPYFRGTAYVVFPNFDLTNTAERIPQFKFEVLQGVTGIVAELDNLSWYLDGSQHNSAQSVTLTSRVPTLLNLEMNISGSMETRLYNDPSVVVVGGKDPSGVDARFITADNANAAGGWGVANIYKIEISDPPQSYYVNMAIVGESPTARVIYDGSDKYKLSATMMSNATITFSATDIDGFSAYFPQYGTVKCAITGRPQGADTVLPLSSVIDQVLLRSGMTADQFDTSALEDNLIAGVCIQSTTSGAEAVGAIVAAFFADPSERDGKLVWVKRGANVVRTLTHDDLTEEPDVSSRENVIEYPMKMSFYYQSPQTGYAMTKATSYRYSPEADSSGEGSATSPVTFYTSDEAAQIAQKLHKVAWTEAAGSFQWKVGLQCIDLVPGDVVGLYLRGIATRARITAVENDGNTLVLSMRKDRQSSYTSQVTSIPLPMPTPPAPRTMSKAVLAVMDIPALQDTDDSLVYYIGVSGSTALWSGAEVQRSLDGGATYSAIAQVTTEATMGRLTAALPVASALYTDSTNRITVQLFDSANELLSQSQTSFDQEQGSIAVQSPNGSWEIMQYLNATDGGNGLWTLDTLKRGRLNTTVTAHTVGALFVKLDRYLVRLNADAAWLGGTIVHRAVSYTTSSESADVVETAFIGRSQIEWSPVTATASYDGATLAVTDIVARDRFGTEVTPIASVNLQGFRITADTGQTVDITGTTAYINMSTIPTSVTIQALNKITGPGQALVITTIASVPVGSNIPEAVINAGGGS